MKRIFSVFIIIFLFSTMIFAQDWVKIVGFNPGSAEITPKVELRLRKAVDNIQASSTILIKGVADHTLWKGQCQKQSQKSDTVLANKRADAVARFYNNLGYKVKIVGI